MKDMEFISGDMNTNFLRLLWKYGLVPEGTTPEMAEERVADIISAFTITVNGSPRRTVVGQGKFKSALLILYLADKIGKDQWRRDGTDRQVICDYFPRNLVDSALAGDQTHQTIYDLLAQGSVIIEVHRPSKD